MPMADQERLNQANLQLISELKSSRLRSSLAIHCGFPSYKDAPESTIKEKNLAASNY